MHPIEIDAVMKSLSTTYNEYFFFLQSLNIKTRKADFQFII